MKSKLYVKYILSVLIIFVSYHAVVWFFFTSKIFNLDNNTSIGDLARMSYQVNMIDIRKLSYDLPKSFIYKKAYNNQKIDVITVGDSFSHGGGRGLNPYYQDYIASKYNVNVLNIEPLKYDQFIETIIGLHNSGYLKEQKVKYIIVQSVERFAITRFAKKIDFNNWKLETPSITNKAFSVRHQKVLWINTGNYKFPYYDVMYQLKEHAKEAVYKFKLSKELFSNHKEMLVFHDDINSIPFITKEKVRQINTNFNKLAKLLRSDNIQLIFMPTTDKYDLYYEYIVDNKHPKNPFYDYIRPLSKDYIFIDEKEILRPMLERGKKDIYFVDDTHWSCNASAAIVNSEVFHKTMGRY